jgi:hypothetical protein
VSDILSAVLTPTRLAVVLLVTLATAAATSNTGHAASSAADASQLQTETCSPGARTIAPPGSRVYPDQGNGGYTSVHTDLNLVYDAVLNAFLPGSRAALTIRAAQCLTEFSLDFERTNGVTNSATPGPSLTVNSVTVKGQPATFRFVQPTYPGDPNGQDDPDPAAHAASNTNPVSATNPNPPACSTQGSGGIGAQCPANKLVITPAAPIAAGETVVVTVAYAGRPGVHLDADGSTEGWFRSNSPANDGGIATTEPVGAMAWMPLNNHPSAKPTYTIDVTTSFDPGASANRVAIAAGRLVSTTINAPDANFPTGSRTFSWRSTAPIANYLVSVAIGAYDVSDRLSQSGILYSQSQASNITPARKALNKIALDQQESILQFLSSFAGPFPFDSMGVIVTAVTTSFEEPMQTQTTFSGGTVGGSNGQSTGTLFHETFEQWFGGSVSESSFEMTFIPKGLGQLAQHLMLAQTAAVAAGGLGTLAGDAAFDASLISRFNSTYALAGSNWTLAPSNPSTITLFTSAPRYQRPAAALLALRQILRSPATDRWIAALTQIHTQYAGGTIDEQQFEDVFHENLPNQSPACHARLDDFFTQWFDTAYPSGGGVNKPQITGPGLAGAGFYDQNGECPRRVQTVALSAIPDSPFNAPDFAVTTASSAGLPIALTATGVCAVTATATIHLTGAVGNCTITASQAGDDVYQPAEPASQTFAVTDAIALSAGGFTYNPITKRYVQTVAVTNVSAFTVAGPVSLVLDNLSPNATLLNATGMTTSHFPYINAPTGNMAPGQRVNVALSFANPTNTPITYNPRTVVGPGPR